mmetsp:Transcript_115656/g.360235  ORF Transcript_115656/g.360235 Transcript_115656/m.360235 type:complete len:429 (-) Transcript_115656:57-1343(-)
MPVAFITIKLPDGGLVHLDVDLKTRIEEFRTILAPKTGVKRHRQRLVFAGRLLQDGRSLEAYGVERNSTIHLLHGGGGGGEGPDGHDISQIPPQLAHLQRHVLQNPDILQQMLESPAMQSLLNDHDFMRSLVKMDPRLQKLLDGCPELNQMLHEDEFMQQAAEALRNPVHVRDVLRSTDRAMSTLENLGGGAFDVLRQMAEDIRRPQEDEAFQMPTKKGKAAPKPDPGEDQDEDADSDAEGTEGANLGPEAPEWVGSFDTNAMASMMQDNNMQQLLSQLVQTLPGPTVKLHQDDPFLDAGFIGQMFHAQTISSMTSLQAAVEKLSLTADVSDAPPKGTKAARKPAEPKKDALDSPAMLSGLNPKSPAANYKESFALFVAAEQESPEIRYKGQLAAMSNMGFTDKEACIQALHSCDGNMNRAVDMLMSK